MNTPTQTPKKYVQNKEIIQSKIAEEVVMLDVESGFYFGLNSVASIIWGLLEKEITFQELIDQLLSQFEVDRLVCEKDTQELLDHLLEKHIIRVVS